LQTYLLQDIFAGQFFGQCQGVQIQDGRWWIGCSSWLLPLFQNSFLGLDHTKWLWKPCYILGIIPFDSGKNYWWNSNFVL
jgi:hypothetical protein